MLIESISLVFRDGPLRPGDHVEHGENDETRVALHRAEVGSGDCCGS